MITIDDIRKIIATDETLTLELKKTTGELKDGMHTACAFLNSNGGWLMFGVTPKSLKVLGQNVTDDTRKEIAGALAGLEPAIDVAVHYVDVPDRSGCQIIAMYFNPFVWGTVPYTYRGRPYYKRESTTVVMPREMFEERLRASNPNFYSWERMPADGIGVEDLNENRIRGTIKLGVESGRIPASALAEPLELLLDKMELLTDGKPNNAAAVLFGTKMKSYPQFGLRMARFRGCDKMEFIDNQRVDGNFFDLLDAGMSFFLKHLNMSGKIVGFTRQESLEIPATALRETLTNALCHRQWEKHNLTIGISIYDDRIEIENPGKFPPQLNSENIKQPHLSYPYNPIMAKVLFQTTFLESWGSGVNRVVETCRKIGVPEPMWEEKMGFIVVTFNKLINGTPEVPPKYPRSTPEVPPKYVPSSRKISRLLDVIITDTYVSATYIMELLELSDAKYFRTVYLKPAIIEGAVELKYPDAPRHPQQQYRLSEKALEWKNRSK